MSAPAQHSFDPSVPPAEHAIAEENPSLEDQTLLILARLMEGGQEDEETCKELDQITRLFTAETQEGKDSVKTKPLSELVDLDTFETFTGYMDMRQPPTVRGHATLTTSSYLKAAGEKGLGYLSDFFHTRVGKATYDDFISCFSVAACLFPVIPEAIAELFLSQGFIVNIGPLMKRKWKSKKVEQAALEMLNAACMNTPSREAIKKYCTEWLDEIVNDVPQSLVDVGSPDRKQAVEDGAIQQRVHSEQVRNLAAVVLAKLQVSSLYLKLLCLIWWRYGGSF